MSNHDETIAAGRVAIIQYVLRDDAGEQIDASTPEDPLPYLHGAQNIVPGLEQALEGKSPGDKISAKIAPEDGYGVRHGPGPRPIPRSAFPDDAPLRPGVQFFAQDEQGQELPLWITDVGDETVHVDVNHPLAGMTLHFEVEVVAVRAATEDEVDHGHPHGVDGQGHH